MDTYFIMCSGSNCGSLAIEKAMYDYMRDVYNQALVWHQAIPAVIEDLKKKVADYVSAHSRSKTIGVSLYDPKINDILYIHVGSMCMLALKVRREIL